MAGINNLVEITLEETGTITIMPDTEKEMAHKTTSLQMLLALSANRRGISLIAAQNLEEVKQANVTLPDNKEMVILVLEDLVASVVRSADILEVVLVLRLEERRPNLKMMNMTKD